MKRVLFVGQKPETVDFSDPSLPMGLTAEKVHRGIAAGIAGLTASGWQAEDCMITPDDSGLSLLEKQLTSAQYDCVVIGAGIRLPPKGLLLFEKIINLVHQAAPAAAIAFNTRPEDTAEAAARWLRL
ncbi:hypothetical protein Lgee_0285 [Legionella geestiana]|uniref:Uncharacterized protein n=1 Tax=Legionella geestiana TaxID=45065 RepID=A0A0W0U8E2_9GAMM|nr:hypothetical protein [Legionella geestiana]KTD04042.1 hypothetical protein Lgee_0285 [Legionella geestiana]QBS12057.1 hypothetical protein E4T54_04490 [Legionella geestiana]QDQ40336.1 hypothetical protein E3226_007965 [Legionella geestiana]STX53223.1 Uncharacterised protein [Legionella geestiana]